MTDTPTMPGLPDDVVAQLVRLHGLDALVICSNRNVADMLKRRDEIAANRCTARADAADANATAVRQILRDHGYLYVAARLAAEIVVLTGETV